MAWLQGIAVLQVESVHTETPGMFTRRVNDDELLQEEFERVQAELAADAPTVAYLGDHWKPWS